MDTVGQASACPILEVMRGGAVAFRGRVAIITGGGSGIGRSCARLMASAGALVVIMGRRRERLENVVAEIREDGGTALATPGSVVEESDIKRCVDQTIDIHGRIDILVNNAGVAGSGDPIHEMQDETWDRVLDTNLTGVFRMSRAVLPHMMRAGSGVIVNVASVAGIVNFFTDAAYCSAKAGVIMLTKHLAVAYAKHGIRCNCVCPAVVDTPMIEPFIGERTSKQAVGDMHPIGRIATPEEVARSVSYLASDEAGFVTGTVLTIDGGVTAQ